MLKLSVCQQTWPIFFTQPLDLTVNGEAKTTDKIRSQLGIRNKSKGNLIQEVPSMRWYWPETFRSQANPHNVDFHMYNHLTNFEDKRYIAKGWKKAGVADVVRGEKKKKHSNFMNIVSFTKQFVVTDRKSVV